MSRNKKNYDKNSGFGSKIKSIRSQIHPETERTILGIILIGITIILILASLQLAGPAGALTFKILSQLFGLGYYLIPLISLVIAISFLSKIKDENQKTLSITFLGASLFVISGLGLIDILFPIKGGLTGEWFGSIESLFGNIASIIITTTFLVVSLILTINMPIKIFNNKKEKYTEEIDPQIIDPANQKKSSIARTEQNKENKKEIEEEKEEELKIQMSRFSPNAQKKSIAPIKNYTPPPLSLLKSTIEKPTSGDLRANANIIKRTLESFGIPVEMGEITIGPKVTRYTLKPAEGIKLSRIVALSQDLSLALAAHPIRMEAPIPGKSFVGIEVPNKFAAIVRLGSLMSFPEFTSSGPLGFILGRDVSGEPIIGDIAKMPHLLIAGSTGSGKSVAIHSLIISLLYKNSPETLRMILIDPKRVELTLYNNIPHLISPVITEGKKSLGVFRWAIDEMDKRYEKLQAVGARDIKSFNKLQPEETLSYIVIVVDELADLMTRYGRDIESSIVRLAQMARATGIHLVLSTQRPSVEVITGLIKANITSRMALQVASQIDSRTILDSAGAEKLLGGGDMLYVTSDLSKPKRIQGAYISEEELHKVTNFIRENNEDSIAEENNNDKTESAALNFDAEPTTRDVNFDDYAGDSDDELYDEAVKMVRDAQKASASLLQRRLSVGYARAARLLDIMEERGIIGPGDGAKPREVYIEKEIKI